MRIGPIDGRGGWLQNLLDRIRPDDAVNGGTSPAPQSPLAPNKLDGGLMPGVGSPLAPAVPGAGLLRPAEISAAGVSQDVSQMLRLLGEGQQQDQMMQTLVALLILLSMMQPQQPESATRLMDLLAQSARFGGSWSITLESTQVQSITVRADYGGAAQGTTGATGSDRFDACA